MNQKELKELVEFLIEKDITEFELERGDVKVRIKRGKETTTVVSGPGYSPFAAPSAASPALDAGTASAAAPASVPARETPAIPAEELHMVRSPIVGTYYESPSPGSPPFCRPGDQIELGQILCIVEAMKLMNEIESDVAGELVKILVNNGQPIEYGQELFSIRVKK